MSKILGPMVVVLFVTGWPFVAVQAAELGAQWSEMTARVSAESTSGPGVGHWTHPNIFRVAY